MTITHDTWSMQPTHRYGRALDDRLPAAGLPPWQVAQRTAAAAAAESADASDITTASIAPAPKPADTHAPEEAAPLTFDDLLDAVNPLHHLPVVGPLYREWTGDQIGPAARIAGGGLFGGLIGAAVSLLDVAIEEISGDDMGGHVMTALFGDDDAPQDPVAVAAAPETARDAAAVAGAALATTAGRPAAAQPTAPPTASPMALPENAPTARARSAPPELSPAAFGALLDAFPQSAPALPPAPSVAAAPTGRLFDRAL